MTTLTLTVAHDVRITTGKQRCLLVPRKGTAYSLADLQRARTLLAYYSLTDRLKEEAISDDYTLFCGGKRPNLPTKIPIVAALIPMRFETFIALQPGWAVVHNEHCELFKTIYLKTSFDWLRKKPEVFADLEQRDLACA